MKLAQHFFGIVLPLLVSLVFSSAPPVYAQSQPAQALVHAVHGVATCMVGGSWQPLQENTPLSAGALLKTAEDATVDLF